VTLAQVMNIPVHPLPIPENWYSDFMRADRGSVALVHMVTISFQQIDRYSRYLQLTSIWREDVARAGNSFREELRHAGIRDLRNVLEHSADYSVGRGDRPELAPDPTNNFANHAARDGRLIELGAFGRWYRVEDAMRAAREFAATLPDAPLA
jgi:hypothetical protein